MDNPFMKELEQELNRQVPPVTPGGSPAEYKADVEAWMNRGHMLRSVAITFAIRYVLHGCSKKAREIVRRLSGISPTRIGG